MSLRFSQGIKIIPGELSFLSGCSRFLRAFYSGGGSVFLGGYILKLAFSHDEALPYVGLLQDALNCNLK